MTQEEKQLLLKDICARLFYGVKGKVETTDGNGKEIKDEGVLNSVFINEYGKAYICIEGAEYKLDDFKPYFRPMSSMTEEEKQQSRWYKGDAKSDNFILYMNRYVEWLDSNHFDWRTDGNGKTMIERGLAIGAPEGMYEIK